MAVQVNSPAPAFELSGVVLFFYPLDFTPI